jgi:hypothetical protein
MNSFKFEHFLTEQFQIWTVLNFEQFLNLNNFKIWTFPDFFNMNNFLPQTIFENWVFFYYEQISNLNDF